MQQSDIAIANMLRDPSIRPDGTVQLFISLENIEPQLVHVQKSIEQTQNSLSNLVDQKIKLTGSFEAIMDVLGKTLSKEDIEKHGKEIAGVKNKKVEG